jgi:acetolactate decarboxylase
MLAKGKKMPYSRGMVKKILFWALALLGASTGLWAEGTLLQLGSFSGLAAGGYDGVFPLDTLCQENAYGLGTFDRLNGEMIVANGKAYQVDVTGRVSRAHESDRTPFACVGVMDRPDWSETVDRIKGKAKLEELVLSRLQTINYPVLVVFDGKFEGVLARSVPAQEAPFERLERVVGMQQNALDLGNQQGTLVGFYFPPAFEGLNVTGFHFHFLNADQTAGGHLLGFEKASGKLSLLYLSHMNLTLPPTDSAFAKMKLGASGAGSEK